jgi:hypothetical protein
MLKRLSVLLCVAALGLTLAGCSKCGWFWDDYLGPQSCRGAAPVN